MATNKSHAAERKKEERWFDKLWTLLIDEANETGFDNIPHSWKELIKHLTVYDWPEPPKSKRRQDRNSDGAYVFGIDARTAREIVTQYKKEEAIWKSNLPMPEKMAKLAALDE